MAETFAGDGEMAGRCRALDWAATPLGPVDRWSHSLRTIVSTLLVSRHPMFLWWGPHLVQLYNDAYRPSLAEGGRHPRALGMRGREFWTDIWDIIGPQIEGVMDQGKATWHEDQLVPIVRNGRLEEVYWTYGYSPVRDDDGSIGGTLVVCQETTARVLADRMMVTLNRELVVERSRLADVFREAPGFAAVLRGPDYVFELANDAYCALVGRRDLIGKTLHEAVPEVAEQGFISILDAVVTTGQRYVGREAPVVLVRTPDSPAEERFVDFVYQPLVEVDGTRSGVVVHGSDVTEQVRARREVERLLAETERAVVERDSLVRQAQAARSEAEIANRAKDDFLALVSHELRSPLGSIANNAQMLAMEICGPVTEKQRLALQRIDRSQKHLLTLIQQLLDLKQIAVGHMAFNIGAVSPVEVLEDASAIVDWQFEKKLHVTFECSDDLRQLRVRADPDKLRQILVNLLTNAAKFTPAGGSVTIGCEADEDRVHITIRDSGIGIPLSYQESVFEPFIQVRDSRQPSITGTGLGLAISRDLARGMAGELTLESEIGVGSAFTVALPRTRPERPL
ncbi:MAG: sensor protein [Gemmatimonadetes bacterium]|nr:sensor protein [Gemmatimonadota bacterium]